MIGKTAFVDTAVLTGTAGIVQTIAIIRRTRNTEITVCPRTRFSRNQNPTFWKTQIVICLQLKHDESPTKQISNATWRYNNEQVWIFKVENCARLGDYSC